MKNIQSILIGAALDGRDHTTFRHATHFAKVAKSRALYLAHIAPSFDLPNDMLIARSPDQIPLDEQIETMLRVIVETQRDLLGPETTVHYVERQGSLVKELVRLAAQKSADLCCLARAPVSQQEELSDSATRLVRKMPCSTLVVPPGSEPRYERILVPIDFSDHSIEALRFAIEIARTVPGSAITIQHTYEVPLGWHKVGQSYEEFAAHMKHNAETRWARVATDVDFGGVPWSIRYDLGEKVSATILDVSNEVNADLMVLGAHGRTQPAGFLMGHVADAVCSRTKRSILCFKRKGEVVNLLHALLQFFQFESE